MLEGVLMGVKARRRVGLERTTRRIGPAPEVNTMCHDYGSYGYPRRYYTRAEVKEWLEGYASDLEQELKAVKEKIDRLSKEA